MPFAVRSWSPIILLILISCGPAASEGGFNSANPAAKMYAIEYAARSGDHSAIRQIVEQLDSDDPAVRCLAIASLKRLTGQTYGFHDFDPPEERQQAIRRWVRALQSGELSANPGGTAVDSMYDHPASLPSQEKTHG